MGSAGEIHGSGIPRAHQHAGYRCRSAWLQLAHITKGVAHEVKNPLNSMRIWLENLKASLPEGESMPQKAVRVLDKEIDRLIR